MAHLIRGSAFVAVLAGAMLVRAVPTVDENSTDAAAIMRAVSNRPGGPRVLSRIKMTIVDSAATRERSMISRSIDGADGRKNLLLIEAPADLRNTAFLSIDHKDQPDESWLYLPKLRRVARVPSGNKADPFVGSDFSLADLSPQDPSGFTFSILQQSTKIGEDDCWLIAAVPRTDSVRDESGYARSELWVSKSKLMVVQLKATLVKGGKTKYMKAADLRKIDGIWSPFKLQMRQVQDGKLLSETVLEVQSLKNDTPEVTEYEFNQDRLTRGI